MDLELIQSGLLPQPPDPQDLPQGNDVDALLELEEKIPVPESQRLEELAPLSEEFPVHDLPDQPEQFGMDSFVDPSLNVDSVTALDEVQEPDLQEILYGHQAQ